MKIKVWRTWKIAYFKILQMNENRNIWHHVVSGDSGVKLIIIESNVNRGYTRGQMMRLRHDKKRKQSSSLRHQGQNSYMC